MIKRRTLKFTRLAVAIALLPLASVPVAAENNPSSAMNRLVGYYLSVTADAYAELYVLNDQRFCFRMVGGSLDLMAAGVWEVKDGRAYFTEMKPPNPLFHIIAQKSQIPEGKIQISLFGHALSHANAPVIGFSPTQSGPFKLRRLFPNEKTSWSSRYTLPEMSREGANYVAIGGMKEGIEEDAGATSINDYHLEIFQIPARMNEVRIGYDRNQAKEPIEFSMPLSPDGKKKIDMLGQFERSETPLTPELERKVKTQCVQPIMNAMNARPSSPALNGGMQPVELLTVQDLEIVKEPWFRNDETEENVDETSISDEPLAPLAPPLAQTTAAVSDLDSFRARFENIVNSEDSATKLADYDALRREAIANKDNNIREVAGRSAVNMTSLLNEEEQYDRSIAISQEAAAILVKSPDPVLRSRAASLLSNQASAFESKGERDRAKQVNQKITDLFARDTYPSTVYVVASNHLSIIDHLILAGDIKAATRRLDRFEKDFIKAGKLKHPPQDQIGFVCYDGGPKPAVECMTSESPDADFIQRYVAAYRAKLSSMR